MISRRGFLAGTAAAMAAWPVQKTVSAPAETPAQEQV
ncbi:MAG: twin-arginine translocation signal domain-containing protein, partial [Verrucomicrobia bacterium]|nr:twin-arginine translocation signal domain-containing protein [Verrucomicrobiota bacterium]MBP5760712.1 twin-arginine translocation signal domain-containing protein [Verrucomicrobiota bacterium]